MSNVTFKRYEPLSAPVHNPEVLAYVRKKPDKRTRREKKEWLLITKRLYKSVGLRLSHRLLNSNWHFQRYYGWIPITESSLKVKTEPFRAVCNDAWLDNLRTTESPETGSKLVEEHN